MRTEYNDDNGCVFAGENVVKGDKESIKNLLEIFDGLLEYLNEEISEESQNGGRQICHFLLQKLDRYAMLFFKKSIYEDIDLNCIFTHKGCVCVIK